MKSDGGKIWFSCLFCKIWITYSPTSLWILQIKSSAPKKHLKTFQTVNVFLSRCVLTIRVLACLFDSVEKCSWSVFSFVFFVSMLINRVRLFRFIHIGAVSSLPLVPSVKIQHNWLSPTVSWNKTSAPLLLFYLTAGRNVCTNKQGLKLTLSHQPNTSAFNIQLC